MSHLSLTPVAPSKQSCLGWAHAWVYPAWCDTLGHHHPPATQLLAHLRKGFAHDRRSALRLFLAEGFGTRIRNAYLHFWVFSYGKGMDVMFVGFAMFRKRSGYCCFMSLFHELLMYSALVKLKCRDKSCKPCWAEDDRLHKQPFLHNRSPGCQATVEVIPFVKAIDSLGLPNIHAYPYKPLTRV